MSFLYFLVDLFIKTFGITQPSAKTRRQAALFILTLMSLTIALVALAGMVLHRWMK